MDKSNSKILTMVFLVASFLVAFSVSLLMHTFAGAIGFMARIMDHDVVKHGLPVLIGLGLFLFLQFNKKVLTWADEVVVEIKKVVWPSRKQTMATTMVVCVMVLISGVLVSTFDLLSGYVINVLIK